MKRKILVPMFASVMALSMNSTINADGDTEKTIENTDEQSIGLEIAEYKESKYKKAVIKDGLAVKIREEGSVQSIAYTGAEFKIIGTQGDWIEVKVEDSQGWLPSRYVDIIDAPGYIMENKVNFRTEADANSEIIEELEVGTDVTVVEDNENWIKVKIGEKEGYVSALYVSEEAPIEVIQSTVNNSTHNNNESLSNIANSNLSNNTTSIKSNENTQNSTQNNTSYNSSASNTSKAQAVINLAYDKIGSQYVWGAEGPNSFDCSGFTSYVYKNASGVSLPRTSRAQAGYGQTVSRSNLQVGDLVFFSTNGTGNISHVGIYVGGGNMVHSPSPGKTVQVTSINSSYYVKSFVTAKRVL